jgi:GNAT superfamily N-acetyltransferase
MKSPFITIAMYSEYPVIQTRYIKHVLPSQIHSTKIMSEIKLVENPKEETYYWQSGAIYLQAFSKGSYFNFICKTTEDADCGQVPLDPVRHRYHTKQYLHRALNPRQSLVCAMKDDEVVGYAWWVLPASLAREEAIWQKIYRKIIEKKDKLHERVFPPKWRDNGRFYVYWRAEEECENQYLGSEVDQTWCLAVLAVRPEFQRQGIGKMLVDFGLRQAQERGEKAYTEASEFGKGLYLQKGFKIAGGVQVNGHRGVTFTNPFMVWEPKVE